VEDPLSISLIAQSLVSIPISFVYVIVLLLFSGFISGAEVAFFSLKEHDIKKLAATKPAAAQRINVLLESPKRLLATILVANNLCNIALIIYTDSLSNLLFSSPDWHPYMTILLKILGISFIILFFGEILPKIYARQNAPKFALRAIPLIHILNPLLSVLTIPLIKIGKWLEQKTKTEEVSQEELNTAIHLTVDESVSEEERNIWKGIVSFGKITVKETMKPRMDVVSLEIGMSYSQVLDKIRGEGYSRMPVYRESFDQIEGVLYIKDLLPFLQETAAFPWQKLLRKPLFVPENKPVDDLLREFQQKKMHLAIVVDEYGGSSGIVTMEDLLEEIVGEINDEFDEDDIQYVKINANTYTFEGKTSLIDLCRIIKIDYETLESFAGESDTLAGLILNNTGHLPQKGETLILEKLTFKVESVDKKRIKRVKVILQKNNPVSHLLSLFIFLSLVFSSCNNPSSEFIPKPMGYPVLNLPAFQTKQLILNCPYTFEYQSYANVFPAERNGPDANDCWINIKYTPFSATLFITYLPVNGNLETLISEANKQVNNHVMMAERIDRSPMVYPDNHVYGTVFRLYGKPATPFQFYLTDSTQHFIRGVLYFDYLPNYDSIAPILHFFEKELTSISETTKWETPTF
jgi:putative hemolysin